MADYRSYEPGYIAADRPAWRWYHWVIAALVALIPLAGGFIGARTFNNGSYKRDEFRKPDFAPPSWSFSPIWSIVYIMMGIASVCVVYFGGFGRDTAVPLTLYVLQLLTAWVWTPLFFGAGLFSLALVDIGVMIGLVFSCIVTFFPVSKVAAVLLIPYFVWLLFATSLNHAVLCLNGCSVHHNFTESSVLL